MALIFPLGIEYGTDFFHLVSNMALVFYVVSEMATSFMLGIEHGTYFPFIDFLSAIWHGSNFLVKYEKYVRKVRKNFLKAQKYQN